MRGICGVLLGALLLVGCFDDPTIPCGELRCPADGICTSDGRCVSEEAVAACVSAAEGAACTADGTAGQCLEGACASVVCGNGRIDPGEVCDDGNVTSRDGCSATCRSDESCGNGVVDLEERCDCGDGGDGHSNPACSSPNSDQASATCRPDCTPHECGDGVRENSEQCEPGLAISETCADFGYYAGNIGCAANCLFDLTGCSETCGDGILQPAEEACDGAPPPGETCLSYGFDRGALACSASLCRPAFADCGKLGWIPNTLDSRVFSSVSGISGSDVWAGGPSGAVLHWDGASWTDASLPPLTTYSGLWAAGSGEAYMASDLGVFHYQNGAWAQEHPTSALRAISGVGSTVVAVGANGVIVRKQAGVWSSQVSNTVAELTSVFVVSDTEAYAGGNVNSSGILLRYANSAWSTISIPPVERLSAVWARNSNDVYVGGSVLLHWDGTNWSAISSGIDADVTSISGTATDVFVAYERGDGPIAQFDGVAWSLHDTRATTSQRSVWAAPDGTAFAAGSFVSRYVGSGWTTSRLGPRVAIRAIGGTSASTAWAVGDRGFAVRFDGSLWRRVPSAFTASPSTISGNFVVGAQGSLGRFNGSRVDLLDTGTTQNLNGVWASSDGQAWAVGDSGVLVHYDGTTVTTQTIASANVYDIWGASPSDIYAVAKTGLLHFNGTTWSAFAGPAGAPALGAIWGFSSTDLYVGGADTYLAHWNGTSWTTVPQIAGTDAIRRIVGVAGVLYLLQGTGPIGDVSTYSAGQTTLELLASSATSGYVGVGLAGSDVFVGGTNGVLTKHANTTWAPQLDGVDTFAAYSSVYAAAENDVYAAGESLPLIHYDGFVWSVVSTGASFLPDEVIGTAGNDVWAMLGKVPALTHWNGTAWTTFSPPTAYFTDIAAIPGTGAFLVGLNGSLARYTGSWQNDTSGGITTTLTAVHATSASSAFAVGNGAALLEWNGSSWAPVSGGPTIDLAAVWAASATNLFVAGLNAISQRNGTVWTFTPAVGQTFLSLVGTSDNDVFAGGAGGTLMHFDGSTWAPVRTFVTGPLSDATVTPKSVLFSVAVPGGEIRGLRRDVAW